MVVRMSSEKAHLAFLLSSTLVYTALKKKNQITSQKIPLKKLGFSFPYKDIVPYLLQKYFQIVSFCL